MLIAGTVYFMSNRSQRPNAIPPPSNQEIVVTAIAPARLTAASSGYATVAAALADPLLLSANATPARKEYPQLLAEAQIKIARLQGIKSTDPFVQTVAMSGSNAGAELWQANEALTVADRQDGFSDLVAMGIGLYIGEPNTFFTGASSLLEKGNTTRDARLRWGMAFNRARAVSLMVPEAAKAFGGPKQSREKPPAVTVDFDESFSGNSNHDLLKLTNSSDATLRHCTVLVELHGLNGDVRQNVHYVEEWPRNEARFAMYGPGIEANGESYGRQTVHGVQRLRVCVWADELTHEDIAYQYAGSERDRDAQLELSQRLTVLYKYHVHAFFSGGPTVTLVPRGVGRLPEHVVTLTFTPKAGSKSSLASWTKSWSGDVWNGEASRKLDLKGELPFDPETMRIELTFPNTTVTYVRDVKVEKS